MLRLSSQYSVAYGDIALATGNIARLPTPIHLNPNATTVFGRLDVPLNAQPATEERLAEAVSKDNQVAMEILSQNSQLAYHRVRSLLPGEHLNVSRTQFAMRKVGVEWQIRAISTANTVTIKSIERQGAYDAILVTRTLSDSVWFTLSNHHIASLYICTNSNTLDANLKEFTKSRKVAVHNGYGICLDFVPDPDAKGYKPLCRELAAAIMKKDVPAAAALMSGNVAAAAASCSQYSQSAAAVAAPSAYERAYMGDMRRRVEEFEASMRGEPAAAAAPLVPIVWRPAAPQAAASSSFDALMRGWLAPPPRPRPSAAAVAAADAVYNDMMRKPKPPRKRKASSPPTPEKEEVPEPPSSDLVCPSDEKEQGADLVCSLCLNIFYKPMLLPCKHSLCLLCYLTAKKSVADGILKSVCPMRCECKARDKPILSTLMDGIISQYIKHSGKHTPEQISKRAAEELYWDSKIEALSKPARKKAKPATAAASV